MIFSWFLIVHTPRMLIDPAGPVGWSEMGESLAFPASHFCRVPAWNASAGEDSTGREDTSECMVSLWRR